MKRVDLKVGMAAFYSESTNWTLLPGGGRRAVIVDVRPYSNPKWGFTTDHVPVENGIGVLVDLGDFYVKLARHVSVDRRVVPLSHLRGEWEPTVARLAEDARVREGYAADRAGRRDTANQRGVEVRGLAHAAGLQSATFDVVERDGQEPNTTIALSVEDLARFLAAHR